MNADPEASQTTQSKEESTRPSRVPGWLSIVAALVLVVVVIVIVHGYLDRPGWVGSAGKKFWDYLELLIVPAALALGVYWLNRSQQDRERAAQYAQRNRELEVEERRAQDAAVQAYYDQVTHLLLEKNLRGAAEVGEVRTLARARTLEILERLDKNRKTNLIRFLLEAELIQAPAIYDFPAISLNDANLAEIDFSSNWDILGLDLASAEFERANLIDAKFSHANLKQARFVKADLSRASFQFSDLSGANLASTTLVDTDFSFANLTKAILIDITDLTGASFKHSNLTGAYLGAYLGSADFSGADLSYAKLKDVDLREMNLSKTNFFFSDLRGANLWKADLRGTTLSLADLRGASLWRADLSGGAILIRTDLSGANLWSAKLGDAFLWDAKLVGTDLWKADLSGANLQEADLSDADLREANLEGTNLTEQQIAQAMSLVGAIMPDGQPYEEWLKDRENNGAS